VVTFDKICSKNDKKIKMMKIKKLKTIKKGGGACGSWM
jgi:hypothetical protein